MSSERKVELEVSARALVDLGRRIDSIGRPSFRWFPPGAADASRRAIRAWEDENPVLAAEHAALVEAHQTLSDALAQASKARMDGARPVLPETLRSTPALVAVEAWLARPEQWMLLLGDHGVGKTVALRHALARRSDTYTRAVDLVADALADRRSERRCVEASTLAVDDLGREGTSEAARRVLFSILDARHEAGRRTVLATNLRIEPLRAHLGEALVDRVRSSCFVSHAGGASLRGQS